MDQDQFEQIEKASDKASEETAMFIIGLPKNKILMRAFLANSIDENDWLIFINEITCVALGIQKKEDLIDNILAKTITKEENILKAIEDCQDIINQIPPVAISATTVLVQKKPESIEHADILSAIENPTPTIATPTFILPNTKPSTSDVLKNLTKPSESIPATIPTAFPPELDLSLDTAGIIDPFKTAAPTSQPGISGQMDAKLSDMTGSATKESFKIVPLSETMKSLAESQGTKKADPYREPIE